ncbi:hypothetical protein SCG7086_AG_00250 [Chlamydiales bacterium SCGC AG-110-P3]|nr:hypothetical protein SCG7086_AG_00250 [Chlamydiales bacterium SCGC AG-110-P3]
MNHFFRICSFIAFSYTALYSQEISNIPVVESNPIRVGSYNVWNPAFEMNYGDTNTWQSRLPHIVATVREADPDILCLQEMSLDCYSDLVSILGREDRYLSFYCPHKKKMHSDHPPGRDGLAVLIKPFLFDGVQVHTSHSSERPTRRRDLWLDVQIPGSGKSIRIATTHLDATGAEKGHTQLANLVEDINKESDDIIFFIVCGDFNEGDKEDMRPRALIMEQSGFISDGSLVPTRPEGIRDTLHKGHIDWIYFREVTDEALKIKFVKGSALGDARASDHKLIYTDFYFTIEREQAKKGKLADYTHRD